MTSESKLPVINKKGCQAGQPFLKHQKPII